MTLELTDNARVAVVGGGPAGSMSACFLLELAQRVDLKLHIDLYDPRDFVKTGPSGCNMCGGVISESLVQKLATTGINLPEEVVMDTIDTYTLHTDSGSEEIRAPLQEMRIASIYRGGGPCGAEHQTPLPWSSFDQFLLDLAIERGARHLPERVTDITWDQGRPRVHCRDGAPKTYDLLVGCVGLNGSGMDLFEGMNFGYRRPQSARAYIAELYLGDTEVQRLLGHAMHVFLLNIPGVKFVAITPKGPYATLIILGDRIDKTLVERVYRSPEVRKRMPAGWTIPVQPCNCQPRIHTGPPVNPFTDRVVLVGDCSASRLYKDGIGAAYRLARACAYTAVSHGISKADFHKHFKPVCDDLTWDNRLGHLMFFLDALFRPLGFVQEAILRTVRHEQNTPGNPHRLSGALWDTFTGSAPYRNIFRRALHPKVVARLSLEMFRTLVRRTRNRPSGQNM